MSTRRASTEPPFGVALVAVCDECAGKHPKPKDVRHAIRAAVKAAGRRRAVAVVASDCLDVCPKRGVTVIVARRAGDEAITCHVVERESDLGRVVDGVVALAR